MLGRRGIEDNDLYESIESIAYRKEGESKKSDS